MRAIRLRWIDLQTSKDPLVEAFWPAQRLAKVLAGVLDRNPRVEHILCVREARGRSPLGLRECTESRKNGLEVVGGERTRRSYMHGGLFQRELEEHIYADCRVEVSMEETALGHLT